ncbi:sodium:proton antiporter [Acidocella sp.]|uniref:cation:proton antiporter n=1 Tax=Acidocella sp. TaxID=50710 RepID=UPI00261A68C9|nr:cation:proton antiporter [Acidocella sp.]
MQDFLTSMLELLMIAIVVALLARRLRLPYSVGLVVAGTGLALSPFHPGLALTRSVIFDLILPPLLFEAAIHIRWSALRQDALPILTLAVPGTLLTALALTLAGYYGLGWPLQPALLFGVLIAATDPVAVIAMFKDNGVHGRLRLLVESESLLNDGVAAVAFALALAWVEAAGQASLPPAQIAWLLAVMVGGGVIAGALCAGFALLVMRRAADAVIEGALTIVLAYGSFLLAEQFHASGVLATVTAGLCAGNLGLARDGRLSLQGREFTLALWDFLAFIANSFVFLLIGLAVAGIPFRELGYVHLGLIIAMVLLGRALAVYPLCALFRGSPRAVPPAFQHVLWWGGLRGALALALALALPVGLVLRNEVLIATFAVVVFSVVFQGLTMPWLLRALRIIRAR